MGKRKELAGCVFGELTVLYATDKRTASGVIYWHCKCECGNEIDVSTIDLTRNGKRTCGHEYNRNKNLVGNRYGRLTVICHLGSVNYNRIWGCICDCGNITIVTTNRLLSGKTKSCGCLSKEKASKHLSNLERKVKPVVGKKFGRLTVVQETGKLYKDKTREVLCKCECGNDYVTGVGYLFKGNVTSCGCIKSRGEYRINNFLREHNIIFSPQYVFNDCRNPLTNHTLPFDFYLPTYNCCIEYDGIQHFKEVPEWNKSHSLEAQQYRDSIKNQYCEKHNINLLRIPYTDFNNIENILISKLQLE